MPSGGMETFFISLSTMTRILKWLLDIMINIVVRSYSQKRRPAWATPKPVTTRFPKYGERSVTGPLGYKARKPNIHKALSESMQVTGLYEVHELQQY